MVKRKPMPSVSSFEYRILGRRHYKGDSPFSQGKTGQRTEIMKKGTDIERLQGRNGGSAPDAEIFPELFETFFLDPLDPHELFELAECSIESALLDDLPGGFLSDPGDEDEILKR
jgi:hypothetical protein